MSVERMRDSSRCEGIFQEETIHYGVPVSASYYEY